MIHGMFQNVAFGRRFFVRIKLESGLDEKNPRGFQDRIQMGKVIN